MTSINNEISKKVIGNAMSAYGLVFICLLLLLNKKDPNINHSFVKSHIHSAFSIHISFIITYIIFITYGVADQYIFLGFSLNHIITQVLFFILLFSLIIWIFRARSWKTFFISEYLHIYKHKMLFDLNTDKQVDEKDKLTFLLSYIPFIAYTNIGKYYKSEIIQNGVRLNILVSIIWFFLFFFWHTSLFQLLLLAYIIFVVFLGINIFTRNEIFEVRLAKIFSPEYNLILQKSIIKYLKNYFQDTSFENFHTIFTKNQEKYIHQETHLQTESLQKNNIRIPLFFIYIPIFNLIFLAQRNNKYSIHIKNGLSISLLFIISLFMVTLDYINNNILILFLFPICFGIGYIKYRVAYKMPYIYEIADICEYIVSWTRKLFYTIKTQKQKDIEVIGKIWETQK